LPVIPRLGNDIVDLKDPLAQGKADNQRFLNKICSEIEQKLILTSPDPNVMLWTLWSIKEASFKAAKKLLWTAKFIPKQFLCHRGSQDENSWTCFYLDLHFHVKVAITSEYVHAIAINLDSFEGVVGKVVNVGDEDEASDLVRAYALDLLTERGVKADSIRRQMINGQPGPPTAYAGEVEAKGCDVSLSHDGRFAAAVVLV